MGNCLIKQLQTTVEDENLKRLGDLELISINSNSSRELIIEGDNGITIETTGTFVKSIKNKYENYFMLDISVTSDNEIIKINSKYDLKYLYLHDKAKFKEDIKFKDFEINFPKLTKFIVWGKWFESNLLDLPKTITNITGFSTNIYGNIDEFVIGRQNLIAFNINNSPITGNLNSLNINNCPILNSINVESTSISGNIDEINFNNNLTAFIINNCPNITGSASLFRERYPNLTTFMYQNSGLSD